MADIRGEMRAPDKSETGEPEIWVNLGDVLHWLDELPSQANSPVAAEVAAEIRQMLYDCAAKGMHDPIAKMADEP